MDTPHASIEAIDPSPWLELLEERFAIPPSAFDDYLMHRPNTKCIHVVARGHEPPLRPEPASIGLPFLRTKMRYPKMTTAATMAFGHLARRHVVALEEAQLDEYLSRQLVELTPAQEAGLGSRGYVIARYQGLSLGQGLYYPTDARGPARLISMFPGALANNTERRALGGPPERGGR